jgi:hypothetical protein
MLPTSGSGKPFSLSLAMTKPRKPAQAASQSGIPPTSSFVGNESWHNFAKLGDEFLQASKFIHEGFKSIPKWLTFETAFQALEHYFTAYLLLKGVTLDHVRQNIGHDLRTALKEAKAKGLVPKVDPAVENEVMKVSEYYTDAQFRYTGSGEWTAVSPHLVIAFVDQIRRDARL